MASNIVEQEVARLQDMNLDSESDGDSVDSLNEEPLLGIVDKRYLSDKRFADFTISSLSKR